MSNSSPHEWIFRKFNFSARKEPFAEFQAFREVISCDQKRGFCIFSCFRNIFQDFIVHFFSSHSASYFWENIYDKVKSNFENIGCSDLLFKVSVFVLRCIFGYYNHRSRKLAQNLTIGQRSLSNSCFQNSKFRKGKI